MIVIFTKALPKEKLKQSRAMVGVQPLHIKEGYVNLCAIVTTYLKNESIVWNLSFIWRTQRVSFGDCIYVS